MPAGREVRYLATPGLIFAVVGLLGDHILSAVKRDLGTLIPSHGGLLDRSDNLGFVAPAVFHFVNYVAGIGLHGPIQIFSES